MVVGVWFVILFFVMFIGGLIVGVVMLRWGKFFILVCIGVFFMVIGNVLVILFGFEDLVWKYYVYIFLVNLG